MSLYALYSNGFNPITMPGIMPNARGHRLKPLPCKDVDQMLTTGQQGKSIENKGLHTHGCIFVDHVDQI